MPMKELSLRKTCEQYDLLRPKGECWELIQAKAS